MIGSGEFPWSVENGSCLVNDLCMAEVRKAISYVYHP